MLAVPDLSRRSIGDVVLRGRGYEVGAGLTPSRFAQVTDLVVIDKRSREDFTAFFGAEPPYPICALAEATRPLDFVTAHHVLEHCPDPIGALRSWLHLVRDGGALFLSVPSSRNSCEAMREVTPIRHLLTDHLFEADGRDFDSRNHVPSFVCQWTVMLPDQVPYAQNGAAPFAAQVLDLQRITDGHDLHWHTFSAETFRQCIEAATYLEGRSASELTVRESADELFATAILRRKAGHRPEPLADFYADVKHRLSRFRR